MGLENHQQTSNLVLLGRVYEIQIAVFHTGQTWLWPDALGSPKGLTNAVASEWSWVALMLLTASLFKLPSAKMKTNEAKRKLCQIHITGLTTLHFPLTPPIQIEISLKKPKLWPSTACAHCVCSKEANDWETFRLKPYYELTLVKELKHMTAATLNWGLYFWISSNNNIELTLVKECNPLYIATILIAYSLNNVIIK